jgi:hypothetical protein
MTRCFRLVAFWFAVLCSGALFAHGTPTPAGGPPAAPSPLARAADDATSLLQNATAAGLQRALDVVAIARQRREALEQLIESDPAAVLRNRLSPDMRNALPRAVLPYLEEDADEEGELQVLHVDYVDSTLDHYVYHLETRRGPLTLHFAGVEPALQSGMRVRARGVKVGAALALDATNLTVTAVVPVAGTLGAQSTLAILVNFSDKATQPFTVAAAQAMFFTTTSGFDYEASYQQTWLTGTVAGWFTIASSSTTCDYTTIAAQAKQKAAAAGHVLSNYRRLVYVFPPNACSWWGLGSVGGNPSQAWINTRFGFSLVVIGHEMGHNFGLYHSHSLDCGSAVLAASGCTASEYGDSLDIMGSNGRTGHYNAFHKERLGWLNAGISPPLITLMPQAGTRTYSIGPLERPRDTTARGLKIARTNSCTVAPTQWLYVESRQAIGFDAWLATYPNVLSGVVVHRVTEGQPDSSYLLDMTPATASWTDPGLVVGQSYADSAYGITITPIAVNAQGATVSVSYATASGCSAAPSMSYSPTGVLWTTAGRAVTYTVTVTNRSASAATFNVTASLPSGWSAPAIRTATIAGGASAAVSLVVTPSAAATAGYYAVTLKATDTAATANASTSTSTIAIATALAATASMNQTAYVRPASGTISARATTRVTSAGAAVSGATVTVRVRNPSGVVTTLTATTDSGGVSVVDYPVTATTVVGSYSVTSTPALGALTTTASTSFAVQ